MSLVQRSLFVLLFLGLGCAAQSNNATDLDRRIERQIRASYQLPEKVQVRVGPRKASEFPEYDSLTVFLSVGDRKQEQQFLISKDNKTLVRFSKMDLTKNPYAEVMSKINLDHRPWRGNADAKVVIVNYDDFQCPYCSYMHQTLFGDIFRNYSDKVKIVYKDFPLYEIHPWASRAAIDSNCLATQSNDAYWAFADSIHASGREISGTSEQHKPLPDQMDAVDKVARDQGQKFALDMNKLNACIKAQDDAAVRASVREAEQLGVDSTPTLFINGYKVNGALPSQELHAAIDRALRDAGEAAPPAAPAK